MPDIQMDRVASSHFVIRIDIESPKTESADNYYEYFEKLLKFLWTAY